MSDKLGMNGVWEACTASSNQIRRHGNNSDLLAPLAIAILLMGIEHALNKQNRRLRAILLPLLNSVLLLILTLYTFDHRLIMSVLSCDSMLMTQPAETWVRESSLPVFLAVTRACMWQAGFTGVRRLVAVVLADVTARSRSKKYQAVHCPAPSEYARLGLEVAGALALAVVLQGHEVCRWAVWTLIAAAGRRMVMKSLSDPHIRTALGLPGLIGTLLPVFRLCEVPFFLKVHQIAMVALDSVGGTNYQAQSVMLPIMTLVIYARLVMDMYHLARQLGVTLLHFF